MRHSLRIARLAALVSWLGLALLVVAWPASACEECIDAAPPRCEFRFYGRCECVPLQHEFFEGCREEGNWCGLGCDDAPPVYRPGSAGPDLAPFRQTLGSTSLEKLLDLAASYEQTSYGNATYYASGKSGERLRGHLHFHAAPGGDWVGYLLEDEGLGAAWLHGLRDLRTTHPQASPCFFAASGQPLPDARSARVLFDSFLRCLAKTAGASLGVGTAASTVATVESNESALLEANGELPDLSSFRSLKGASALARLLHLAALTEHTSYGPATYKARTPQGEDLRGHLFFKKTWQGDLVIFLLPQEGLGAAWLRDLVDLRHTHPDVARCYRPSLAPFPEARAASVYFESFLACVRASTDDLGAASPQASK